METLLFNVYREAKKDYECSVVAPKGAKAHTNAFSDIFEVPTTSPKTFLLLSTIKSYLLCKKLKPDVIIGGSGLVAPIVSFLSNHLNIKSILFLHGLDIIAPSILYQKFFVPAIRRIDKVVVNSRNTELLARNAGITPSRITILHPGVNTNSKHSVPTDSSKWRSLYNIEEGPIILSVGRLTPRKGIAPFIENCLPFIQEKIPNIQLVIIGDEAKDAVNMETGELKRIRNSITKHNLQKNITFLGRVSDDTLHQTFSIADAFIFPLVPVKGDVEGFGMVALEAASFGVPTIAFKEGGVDDAIRDGVSGHLIQSQDHNAFTNKVLEVLIQKDKFNKEECKQFSAQFSWPIFGAELRKIIQNLCS